MHPTPTTAIPDQIEVYDTHTEGEPTRIVVGGWPQPQGSTMLERRSWMEQYQDHLRQAVVCEPRGHDAIVGALLTPPESQQATAGIVFFNNTGYLGMCGHGLIGVVRALQFVGRIQPGPHFFDTPVGPVEATLEPDGMVSFRNVPSLCLRRQVTIEVPRYGSIVGDVAWGGNGFFITDAATTPLTLKHLNELLARSRAIAEVVDRADFLPSIGIEDFKLGRIDHVEFTGADTADATAEDDGTSHQRYDARNFVLCPGGDWDRSPCGTGTSAKLAVLHDRGELAVGQKFRQRSITGGVFSAWLEESQGELYPHIRGSAWVVSHATLQFAKQDPLATGFSLYSTR